MARYRVSFEGGLDGQPIATGSPGTGDTDFSAVVVNAGGALTWDNDHPMHGTLAMKVQPAANQNFVTIPVTSHREGSVRGYFYGGSAPGANTVTVAVGDASGGRVHISRNSNGTLKIARNSGVALWTSSVNLPLSQTIRWELGYKVDAVSTAASQINFAAYPGDDTTPITGMTTGGPITVTLGSTDPITTLRLAKYDTVADTQPYWLDEFMLDDTSMALLGPHVNAAPIANAGPDQSVGVGASVTLTGAASSDPDGYLTGYTWTQISGPAATLTGSGATRTFTPATAGVYVFGLVVTDNDATASTQDTVTITAAAANISPTVTAAPNPARAGQTVTLTATDPDGTIASWSQTGTPVTLQGTGSSRTFIAPPLAAAGQTTITVTDEDDATGQVIVDILPTPHQVRDLDGWKPTYRRTI